MCDCGSQKTTIWVGKTPGCNQSISAHQAEQRRGIKKPRSSPDMLGGGVESRHFARASLAISNLTPPQPHGTKGGTSYGRGGGAGAGGRAQLERALLFTGPLSPRPFATWPRLLPGGLRLPFSSREGQPGGTAGGQTGTSEAYPATSPFRRERRRLWPWNRAGVVISHQDPCSKEAKALVIASSLVIAALSSL